jgi:DNA anti-recombination protein RmuC
MIMAENRTSWALLAAGTAAVAAVAMRRFLNHRVHVFKTELIDGLKSTRQSESELLVSQVMEKMGILLSPAIRDQEKLQPIKEDIGWIKERFQNIRSRGRFGERQLEDLLRHSPLSRLQYDFQYTLSNNRRVDCVVRSKLCLLPIDSKFPLESLLEDDKVKFKQAFKKHITDIASKYILSGETTDFAIMLLPSDGDFQTVMEHPDIWLFANTQRVYLHSPTTLMCSLHHLNAIARTVEVSENHKAILKPVEKLTNDVDLLLQHFRAAEKRLDLTKKDFDKIQMFISNIRKHRVDLESLGCFPNNKNSQVKPSNMKSGSADEQVEGVENEPKLEDSPSPQPKDK